MTRRCELTGVGPMTGNHVSHSHRATKRRFLPNLIRTRLHCQTLGQDYLLRISASALRSVDKAGGLDAFLVRARDTALSTRALRLKRAIIARGKASNDTQSQTSIA